MGGREVFIKMLDLGFGEEGDAEMLDEIASRVQQQGAHRAKGLVRMQRIKQRRKPSGSQFRVVVQEEERVR